ncbi:MAG TPA: AMP-binding protein, partial [Pyrinomonadaceae bacterium]|nr:AMP-binding protein [Pyrinomonadaceae bacterium]
MTGTIDNRSVSARQVVGRGEPLLPDEPRTLAELFVKAERDHGRSDALNYKSNDSWHAISNHELVTRAENIALGLYELGLRKGDRAAILAPNSPDWTIADAG